MNGVMSAIGAKRTLRIALHMSAFGGKADIATIEKKRLTITVALQRTESPLRDKKNCCVS